MSCVHYWLIDDRNYGVCKLCREERQFRPRNTDNGIIAMRSRPGQKERNDQRARQKLAESVVYDHVDRTGFSSKLRGSNV